MQQTRSCGRPVTATRALGVYEIHGGAAPLEPGEEVSAIVDYRQPPVDDDVGCDLPDGRYDDPARYEPVVAGEWLMDRFQASLAVG